MELKSSARRYTSQGRHQSKMTTGGGIKYGRSYGAEFDGNELYKEKPATCARCVTGRDAGLAPVSMKRKARKWIKNPTTHQARRPRAAHGRGFATRDATSESDEDEEERAEWSTRKYGVRMSPAHPRYVGRGDDTCGGVSRSHLVTFRYIWSLVIKIYL